LFTIHLLKGCEITVELKPDVPPDFFNITVDGVHVDVGELIFRLAGLPDPGNPPLLIV
jgi:hypothetical protein